MAGGLEFKILGSLEVTRDGVAVALPSAKQRIVLATLLLRTGQVVEVDELIDNLWQQDVPSAARATAQAYVMRLRRSLGEPTDGSDVLRTQQNGYLLSTPPQRFDLASFQTTLGKADEAGRTGDRPAEAAFLHEALALWRGRPLSNVPSDSLRRKEIPWLEEARLQALERRLQIDLDSGRHRETVSELRGLVSEHPLREQFWMQLMLALYRANRQADALDTYRKLGRILDEELGLSPGEEVQRLHAAILNQDTNLDTPNPAPAVTVREPSMLPPDMADFVGRDKEIVAIMELLTPKPPERSLRLVVLSGAPGVGKTALAVHIGHLAARYFPDGDLYVNLLGYAPGSPMTLRRALTHLLRALGMRPEQVPLDTDEQVDLYRSLLAGQRRLIVLDNAISPYQVRPLLPLGPGCAVLVTSRNELRGLTALQGARRVAVEPLRAEDARALLAEIAGPDSVAAEPGASDELVQLCGRLPLAVRIAATNLSSRSKTSVTEYVSELQRANRLADLAIDGDDEAAVHIAFGLSYETLKPEPQHLFRMLGLAPGHDVTAMAAAALVDESVETVRKLLDQLVAASLIQHHSPDRYQFHDLLRLYAGHRAHTEESEQCRAEALHRLYDFYLTAADAAAGTLNPELVRLSRPRPIAVPAKVIPQITDRKTAIEWLNSERANLVAAIDYAAKEDSLKSLSWHLADAVAGYLHLRRHDGDLLATATVALEMTRERGDRVAEATTLNTLGVFYWSVGDYPAALEHCGWSLELHKAAGNAVGASTALTNMGVVYLEDGRLLESARAFDAALELGRGAGAKGHAAVALARLGHVQLEMGELTTAKEHLEEALTTCRALRLMHTEATVLNTLGAVHLRLGEFDNAIACHEEALERYRVLGSRHDQAEALQNLAAVHRDARRYASAVDYGQQALELARQTRNVRFEVDTLNTIGTARHGMRDWTTAQDQHGTALGLARRIGYRQGEITALIGLAGTRAALGLAPAAVSAARDAVELARSTRFRLREAQALLVLAEAELQLGQYEPAATHAEEALRLHRQARNLLGQGRSERVLGELAAVRGDDAAADRHRSTAARLLLRLGLGE